MQPDVLNRDDQAVQSNAEVASIVFRCGVFFAAALLVIENGLSVFAVALALASLLLWIKRTRDARPRMPSMSGVLIALSLVAVAAGGSLIIHHLPLSALDNLVRLLLIPWCAVLAFLTGLRRDALWRGAMVGLLIAFGFACWQIAHGAVRAGGDGNPIVFATLVLVLVAIALFAAPAQRSPAAVWPMAAVFLLGGIALVMSGSRGALPGWLLLGVVVVVRGWRSGRPGNLMRLSALAVAGTLLLALLQVPELHAPLRLADVSTNLSRYAQGDPDTPIGARLALLSLAGQVFAEHPWVGVGLGRFGNEIAQLPGCQGAQPMGLCVLGHAHNDLAEWAVTMGFPGACALIAIYTVPFFMFVRIIRTHPRRPNAAAWTGLMVVAIYLMGGLTQSMFAHAATASAYGVFVGTLLGIAWRESATDTA